MRKMNVANTVSNKNQNESVEISTGSKKKKNDFIHEYF